MKLSIITINLNNRNGLQKTINSVVAQSFRDFEWIVIDGGSTDGSRELIEQNAKRFVYWVSEPDKGIYNAMNKGMARATGDYLLFMNSGDWLCNETSLERCFAHEFNADVMYGDCFLHFSNHDVACRYPSPLTFEFLYNNCLSHSSSFIRREMLVEEGYDENMRVASDYEFWLKLVSSNGSFCHLDEFVSVYDASGISSTNHELLKVERERLLAKYIPQMVQADYARLKDMQTRLSDAQVKGVLQYGHKKKLYHKLITASLVLCRFFDKYFR